MYVLTAATESVCQSFFKIAQASTDLFCTRHVCVQKYSCVCPQQQLVGQPLTLGCNPAAIGRPTLACVYSETHMCMPTAAIGRPFLDPWVQPSIDFFFNTCVCAHSRNWPAKVLNVQNLHLASSLGYSATHMCVFTAALGRPTLSCPLLQHMCVCAYSSNRSAKAF